MSNPSSETTAKPNPGSDEAIDLGCTCPVLDNERGQRSDGLFWYSATCPVHDKEGAARGPQTIVECLRHAGMSEEDTRAMIPGYTP